MNTNDYNFITDTDLHTSFFVALAVPVICVSVYVFVCVYLTLVGLNHFPQPHFYKFHLTLQADTLH